MDAPRHLRTLWLLFALVLLLAAAVALVLVLVFLMDVGQGVALWLAVLAEGAART